MRHPTALRQLLKCSSSRALCQRCYATTPNHKATPGPGASSPSKLYNINDSKKRPTSDTDEMNRAAGREDSTTTDQPQLSREEAVAEAREAVLRRARRRTRMNGADGTLTAKEEEKARAKSEYDRKYKAFSRRWVNAIVALPILLVTSYYLFDRLALGHPAKELPEYIKQERARNEMTDKQLR